MILNYFFIYSSFGQVGRGALIAIFPEDKISEAQDYVNNHSLPKDYIYICKGKWGGYGEIPDPEIETSDLESVEF